MVTDFFRREYDEMWTQWNSYAAGLEKLVNEQGIIDIGQAETIIMTTGKIKAHLRELLSVAEEDSLGAARLASARKLADRYQSLEGSLKEARNTLLAEHVA